MTETDRRWDDADRELTVNLVASTIDQAAAADSSIIGTARAVVTALSAAGRLADPQELERLRAEADTAWNAAGDMAAITEAAAKGRAEAERLRARVVELQQALGHETMRRRSFEAAAEMLTGGPLSAAPPETAKSAATSHELATRPKPVPDLMAALRASLDRTPPETAGGGQG